MKVDEQLPRTALAWIIAAQALLLLPHLGRLPPWVVALYLGAFAWRVQAFRGRLALPGPWLKVALSGAAAGGVVLSFGSLLGMEPMVAFLLTAFALKLTEMRSRKDAYLVLFLGYFVCLTAFLFSQDLLLVLYGLIPVWVLTTALICVHRPQLSLGDLRPARLAALMLVQAVPLMLVLFFLFPRIGPLWTMPLKSQAAKTGMSDVLRPGDVSQLTQSDEVAFRVRFDGEIPPVNELYWRGIVMSHFDGEAWRTLRYFEVPATERRETAPALHGPSLAYSVLMAPTQQHWLYALRYARAEDRRALALADFRLYSPMEVETEFLYRVRSWPEVALEPEISRWRRRIETTLPVGTNPQTQQLARALRARAGSDRAFIDGVLAYLRENDFRYTLQPPLLPTRGAMDSFLFDSRRGFCEHYAYAFALMMRAVDIPARIVGGYLGGEVNPVNRTVIVHQFDAHAWNEVWLEGEGWVRVDPTSVVAPDRLLYGLERAVAGEGSFLADSLLSPLRYRGVSWVNYLRLRYDALTYRWQSWMTGFDGSAQIDLLRGVLGEISMRRLVMVLIGSGVLVLGAVAFPLLRQRERSPHDPFVEELQRFCDQLHRRGLTQQPGETPAQLAERAAERWPTQREQLLAIYRALARAVYGRPLPAATLPRLQRDLRRQRRRLRLQ